MSRNGSTAVAVRAPDALAVSDDELRVLKATLNPDLSDAELRLFALVAKRSGLDPFAKQIFAVKRQGRVTFQTSQEGYLSIAARTGEYDGCDEPEYGPMTGNPAHPEWATVRVYRKGMARGVAATAYWSEYYPGDQQGHMWKKMPRVMLAKVARVAALRLAFPYVYADLYSEDEMAQADRPVPQASRPAARVVEGAIVDTQTGEIVGRSATHVPEPDDSDIAALHGATDAESQTVLDSAWAAQAAAETDAEQASGLSSRDLFERAEAAGFTKAQLTLAAKTMFGVNRWKITDLTDEERSELWDGMGEGALA